MNRTSIPKNGLQEFAEALAFCLNFLLDEKAAVRGNFPSGWGEFKITASRESRNHVQLLVDAGIFSKRAHIFGDVHAEITRKAGSNQVGLVLVSR